MGYAMVCNQPPSSESRKLPDPPGPEESHLKRVFLLEDNDANAMVFEGYLELAGCCEVTRAASLAEMDTHLPDIIAGCYDLLVLDLMLPDGEGMEYARSIADKHSTPITVYTAKLSPPDMIRYGASNVIHVFSKPLHYRDFQAGFDRINQELAKND